LEEVPNPAEKRVEKERERGLKIVGLVEKPLIKEGGRGS